MTKTSTRLSNQELRARVQKALDAVLPYEAVHIGVGVVDGGTVTLNGTVLTRAERAAVLEAALAAGAQAVADELRVEGDDLHPTDTQIATAVQRAVRHAERVASDFVVPVVSEGRVALYGEVATGEEADAARTVSQHVRGVVAVDSRLRTYEGNR